ICLQVAGFLSPKDLLNLSRTSRVMRNALMGKRAKHVWVSAQRAVGFPAYRLGHLSSTCKFYH
ncbi:hypothetical protein DFH11DRAFT_1516379, partial [Phellopilus nigrolimitatus]